jgi:DNA-binding NarL/FixJ family response regulator
VSAGPRKRILAVDDHAVALEGIRAVLSRDPALEVVSTAATGEDALRQASAERFDAVVVDLDLPDLASDEVIRRLAGSDTPPAIVAYAMASEAEPIRAAIAAGARGIASKAGSRDDLLDVVRSALAGDSFVSPVLANVVLDLARGTGSALGLDDFERSVLRGVARGDRAERIASDLGVSTRTVESARARLKSRLGAKGTADLVRAAMAAGLVDE